MDPPVEIARQLSPPPPLSCKPSVSEVLSQNFAPFDHRAVIIEPFDGESKRDTEFQESECMRVRRRNRMLTARLELSTMLIEMLLEFHAWSTARPVHESDRTADALEKEINAIMEAEKEQGMSSVPPCPASFVGRRMFFISHPRSR